MRNASGSARQEGGFKKSARLRASKERAILEEAYEPIILVSISMCFSECAYCSWAPRPCILELWTEEIIPGRADEGWAIRNAIRSLTLPRDLNFENSAEITADTTFMSVVLLGCSARLVNIRNYWYVDVYSLATGVSVALICSAHWYTHCRNICSWWYFFRVNDYNLSRFSHSFRLKTISEMTVWYASVASVSERDSGGLSSLSSPTLTFFMNNVKAEDPMTPRPVQG